MTISKETIDTIITAAQNAKAGKVGGSFNAEDYQDLLGDEEDESKPKTSIYEKSCI